MQTADIFAVDGGGTKTLLVRVRPDASIAAIRTGGGSNPFDAPSWRDVLSAVLCEDRHECCAGSFGLAGYGESDSVSAEQERWIAQLFPARHVVRNDVAMAWGGAFADGPGILLLSGTGSVAWGRNAEGQSCRIGGWGCLFGDEGSAFWIGRAALSLLAALLDGRNAEDESFLAPFCRMQGLPLDKPSCGKALLRWYGALTQARPEVAKIAMTVAQLAEEGSVPARRIMSRAAAHLARHIEAARVTLDGPDLPWSYAGGTMRSVFLRQSIAERCGAPIVPRLPPIGGGIVSAAELAGWPVDARWVAALRQALEAQNLL